MIHSGIGQWRELECARFGAVVASDSFQMVVAKSSVVRAAQKEE